MGWNLVWPRINCIVLAFVNVSVAHANFHINITMGHFKLLDIYSVGNWEVVWATLIRQSNIAHCKDRDECRNMDSFRELIN